MTHPFWVVDGNAPLNFEVVRGSEESVGSSFYIVDGPYDTAAGALQAIDDIFDDLQGREDDIEMYSRDPNLGGW